MILALVLVPVLVLVLVLAVVLEDADADADDCSNRASRHSLHLLCVLSMNTSTIALNLSVSKPLLIIRLCRCHVAPVFGGEVVRKAG